MCVLTRGASKGVYVFPVKDVGSDTAGAARAAALVWGIGEEGMIWGWWGMGVSGFTGPSAAFLASCVYVCVTCVCVDGGSELRVTLTVNNQSNSTVFL